MVEADGISDRLVCWAFRVRLLKSTGLLRVAHRAESMFKKYMA